MIRWDAPIFFANTASFKSRVKKHIGRFLENNSYPKPWCLCLCFSGVNDVDFTGLEMLAAFFSELQEKEHVLWEIHEAEKWWDERLGTIDTEDMGAGHPMHGHHVPDHSLRVPEDDDEELINQV